MSRIILVLLLVLASFNANAGTASVDWKTVNDKIDCIIAHGGMHSKKASVCFQTNTRVHETIQTSATTKVVANVDKRPRDAKGLYHWKNVNGNPAKAAYRASAKGAHPEIFIGKKIHDDLIAMGLTSNDMDKVFHPIFNQVQENLGLLKGKESASQDEKWNAMLRSGDRYPDFIQKGDVLNYLSFRKGIIQNVVADFNGNLPTFVFPLENGKELLWIPLCQNFAIREGKKIIQPMEKSAVVTPPQKEMPPSISPNVEENVAILKTTVGVWAGIHTSPAWDGHFSGFKATVTLPVHTYLGLEDEQVWVGLGIRGEQWRGNSTLSQYMGKGSRFVPAMLVVDWNGTGGLIGDVHAGSFNAGVGGNWMHGRNSGTGYFKDQYGKEVHVRLEECERKGKWVTCLYAEGNGAFGKIRMTSSWSGDTPDKTSSLTIGGSVEYLITDHWSVKGILEGSINDRREHAKLAITAAVEACYRDHWEGGDDFAVACAGPYIRLGEYDGYTFGGTGNIFVGKIWTYKVAADKSNAVSFPEPVTSPFIQSSSDRGQEEAKIPVQSK